MNNQETTNEAADGRSDSNAGLGRCSVPVDHAGEPRITTEMKAAAMGEFSMIVYEQSEDGLQMIPTEVPIPWTTCKEIYKLMVNVARRA